MDKSIIKLIMFVIFIQGIIILILLFIIFSVYWNRKIERLIKIDTGRNYKNILEITPKKNVNTLPCNKK